MKKSLHAKTIYRSNLLSDLRIAKEAGFSAIEAVGSTVLDFLASGLEISLVQEALRTYDMKIISVNDIANVERTDPESVAQMCKEAEQLSQFCQAVDCKLIQLVPLCAHAGKPWEEVKRLSLSSIVKVLDIGAQYGVSFQLEPVAWSPICSLSKALEVIAESKRDNFKTAIDFWHLWYGGETTPEDVAHMDPNLIANIHFCDGKRNPAGTVCDEEELRGYYAGEGDIPLAQWVEAVRKTGYDGYWSYELISRRHWEMDTLEVAQRASALLDQYVAEATV